MRIALIAAQCHGASRGGAAVGRAPRSRRGRRRPCGAVRARRAGDPRAPRPRPLRPPALHDRAPGGLLPPRAPGRRRPERRLGGALLLRAGARAAGRPRAPPALRPARRLRGAAGEARPARPRARRPLPRALDANDHVDREAAARSGVGFYGKNTLLITRRHGSWVVLGTLVTAAALEPTPPLAADCGSCRLCVDACPTGALDEPGTLDATRCLAYWTQVPEPIPPAYRAALGAQVYGCDVCQDVCPWNRGIERRRAAEPPDAGAHVDLVAWLEGDLGAFGRLYVPRRDPRWLRRNALVAAGNVGAPRGRLRRAVERHARGGDPMLAEHARWALERMEARAWR